MQISECLDPLKKSYQQQISYMTQQYIFQKDYTEDLHSKVKNGDSSSYHANTFDYNQDASFPIELNRRDDLLAEMLKYTSPQQDYEAAIILFEAFPNLNRIQASYSPFWVYLAHVDLYPYMVNRFCNGNKPSERDIKNHWWNSNLMRRGLSNLWWSVKQTIDESHPTNKYHYTKYFFKHLDFRQRRMGTSTLFRQKEVVLGILRFLEENITDYFEGRANYIIMYYNKQATLRELSVCSRDDIYNELMEIKSDILQVKKRTEVADALGNKEDYAWDDEDE